MKAKRVVPPVIFSLKKRIIFGGSCVFVVLFVVAGAWTIPYVFESPSILYKFGMDKTLLRTGQILGVTVPVLMLFQVLLISRLKLLDRIFSLNRIYGFHRKNGLIIASLALWHPILIIASNNFTFFAFEKRYWPQFVGVGELTIILVVVITANWRSFFGFAFHRWLRFHRLGTISILAFLPIHILFVSGTFKSGFPHTLVFVVFGIIFFLIFRIWSRRFFPGKRRFLVSSVLAVGRDACSVTIRHRGDRNLDFIPGQFAFITPVSRGVPREEHPFTIASTPSRPDVLQFVIRMSGDWTSKINHLKVGETVIVDGPYGLFSHMAVPEKQPVLMIADGIGITPMLSMIRYMADIGDRRQVLLIWSNKTAEHIIFPKEFKKLENRLQHFRIIHVFTRGREDGGKENRLDQITLEKMLNGWSRISSVFICGPVKMMKDMNRALKKIGFSSARLYKEEFKL